MIEDLVMVGWVVLTALAAIIVMAVMEKRAKKRGSR